MQYKARYIDGVASEPSLAMLFGHTVHTALETLLQGHRQTCLVCHEANSDHLDCARQRYWQEFDQMRATLRELEVEASSNLYLEGLRMIDQVGELKLNSDSCSKAERSIRIPTSWAGLDWPVVGAVDLWSPPWSRHGAVIFDFKTTAGGWGEARCQRERWQPLLYTWAYLRAYDVVPTFKYIVLNRIDGGLTLFERSWKSRSAWWEDFENLQFSAEEIAEAVRDGNFACAKRHGSCLECGEPFGHEHVCRTPARKRVQLTGKANGSIEATAV